ncbi:MAG: aspartyl/glutamyl-tRNA amidotransferase subunit C [Treponema sp.]|jgi:aspartyl-tRNA(Asn)/glutamyl-tRNA(Gln) amidotransferase subunit C|nr:aspartyl/glutamyl-tRNA amidotransferase subunit C [Treponema sp.]
MNIEDLRETAALAHLNLGDEELSGAFAAFEEMLGFFTAMQVADRETPPALGTPLPKSPATEFPVTEIPATEIPVTETHAAGISAVARIVDSLWFRADGAADKGNGAASRAQTAEQMLDSAGERDGRFVVVPNVL